MMLVVWTSKTSSELFENYLSQKTTFDTRAISPSDEEVFELLEIVFCSTHWINDSKARDLGLDNDLLEYASLILDLVSGEGLDLISENLSDPIVRSKYVKLHDRLYSFIQNHGRLGSIREFYEALAIDYTQAVVKKKLCPEKKGNFCFYTHVPQASGGYTIRKGRVCQQLVPKRDFVATLDPLQNEINVEFHLQFDHQTFPPMYADREEIKNSVRVYLGELISTGLSKNTGLSFEDIIFLPVNDTRFCKTKISATLYHLNRLSRKNKPCQNVPRSMRHPQNYPADTCRLRCVDAVYYKRDQKCSLFDPLYNPSGNSSFPLCSPVQLYDALNSEARTETDPDLYQKCDEKSRCGGMLPCDEWLGELTPQTTCSTQATGVFETSAAKQNTTKLVIAMNPISILVIHERLLYTFAYTYSSIGGVMGITLGASIVSVTHFLMYCVKHLFTVLRYLSNMKALK